MTDNQEPRLRAQIQRGPAGSEVVALVHGVGSNLSAWDSISRRLADRFTVLRYDLRGHGESDKPAGPYCLDDFVNDHLRILDQNGITQCHLVGFSLGGLIAQAVAVRHAERTKKLVLISTIAGRNEQEQTAVKARLEALRLGGPSAHLGVAAKRWFTDEFLKANPELVESRRSQYLGNDARAYLASYEVLANNDLDELLPSIKQKTLIITGEADAGSTARMALRMASRIPKSEVKILPKLKHGLLAEAPDLVAGLVHDFL